MIAVKKDEARTSYLGIRFSKQEFRIIKGKADALGVPMSTYLRMIVKEKLSDNKIKGGQ